MREQNMAAGARLAPGETQARPRQIRDACQHARVALRQDQPLLSPGPGNSDKAAPGQELPRRGFVEAVAIGVEQMAGGDQSLTGGECDQPIQAAAAA